ncbi:hypothetical protein ACO0SA_004225 [Hanseniaspora valbyensis]
MSKSDLAFDILDCNDLEEFEYLRTINRYNYENNKIKWNSQSIQQHLSYSRFELDISHNLERFRHILERYISKQNGTAISISLWLQYIDMEIRYGNYNHARNLFKRSININNGTNRFILYLKYVEFEHMMLQENNGKENVNVILGIFKDWRSKIFYNETELLNEYYKVYLKYMMLYYDKNNTQLFRKIFIEWFITTKSFTNWLDYEVESSGKNYEIRSIFGLIIDKLSEDEKTNKNLLLSVIKKYIFYEFNLEETDRIKALIDIYKHYENEDINDLKLQHIINIIENTQSEQLLNKNDNLSYIDNQKVFYKNKSETFFKKINEMDYNNVYSFWLEYSNFLEAINDVKEYENLIIKLKPDENGNLTTKSNQLKICIKIWINYLIFIRKHDDEEKIDKKWEKLLNFVKIFKHLTFKKVWINYLNYLFETKDNQNLWQDAFKTVVTNHGKPSIFKSLINQLYANNKFDEIRFVYNIFISYNPLIEQTWKDYVKLETMLQDGPRVRYLYTSIISIFIKNNTKEDQYTKFILNCLNDFVKFETEEGEYSFVRKEIWAKYLLSELQEDGKEITNFFKNKLQVWIDCAYWELKSPTEKQLLEYDNEDDSEAEIQMVLTEDNKNNCRAVFSRGIEFFKDEFNKKLALLNQYIDFEKNYGNDIQLVTALEKRLPVNGVFVDDNDVEESNKLDGLMDLIDQLE